MWRARPRSGSSPGRAAARCTSASTRKTSAIAETILGTPSWPTPNARPRSSPMRLRRLHRGHGRLRRPRAPARVVLITECSMGDNVALRFPEIDFVRPCNLCPHMKRITLQNIWESLEQEPRGDRRSGDRRTGPRRRRAHDRLRLKSFSIMPALAGVEATTFAACVQAGDDGRDSMAGGERHGRRGGDRHPRRALWHRRRRCHRSGAVRGVPPSRRARERAHATLHRHLARDHRADGAALLPRASGRGASCFPKSCAAGHCRRWPGVAVGSVLAALAPPDTFKAAFVLIACLIALKLLVGGGWVLGERIAGCCGDDRLRLRHRPRLLR